MNSYLAPKISSFCVANLRTPRVLLQQGYRIASGRTPRALLQQGYRIASGRTPRALLQQGYRIASGRNSLLLRAIRALNLNILDHNLLHPE
ncbi:MAG: hypothetical protein COC09_02010 [Gammaproteobacteria bacterium]|nr:MAG: hypothetical protein COC09_07975 [Gammaproteobacteria bacterium]PCH64545.1 MAG: hypothetical protein COC09_02010 [Gammaproteobacteria bacterium]